MTSAPTSIPPSAPAWFAHRVGDERRLGVAFARGDAVACADLGVGDELAWLADGRLDRAALEVAIDSSPPIDPATIVWDVPVARPSKILCLGKNYAAHAAEFGAAVPEEPIVFAKLMDTLAPHEGTVLLPHRVDSRVDHEVELGVVLGFADPNGHGQKYVDAERALELVAGWTVLDDVTARTIQGTDRDQGRPWLRSKSFDTFCPIGPWVVARDGLDASDLAIDLWVNDEHRQSSRTSKMVVDVAAAIAWLSQHTTLRPGDILATGTPAGVGPLAAGDVVTAAIEGVGVLRHRVAREPTP